MTDLISPATAEATENDTTSSNNRYQDYVVSQLAIPCVYYIPSLVDGTTATAWYSDLHANVPWTKTAKINRWVTLFEDKNPDDTNINTSYQYRDAPGANVEGNRDGNTSSLPFSPTIRDIQQAVERLYAQLTGNTVAFNTCLANFYQDGSQRIGWHADREELGRSTPIASVSLGAVRQFAVRHKVHGVSDRVTFELASGSVVFMENVCQQEYLHCIPKQPEVTNGRINLTFRCKTQHTAGEIEHERRDTWLQDLAQQQQNKSVCETKETMENSDTYPLLFGDDIPTYTVDPDTFKIQYTLSCNIGTEGPTAAEALELLSSLDGVPCWHAVASPYGVRGYVALCIEICDDGDGREDTSPSESNVVVPLLLQMRSVLHVMEYHDHFTLGQVTEATSTDGETANSILKVDGESIYQFYKQRLQENPELISTLAVATSETPRTFRVTCERTGAHAFQAPTVEYEMGGAMSEFYGNCQPKMKDYDVHIRVDVVCDQVMIGTQLNVHDLSKRHFLRYRNAVTVKTNLAYIMLRYANIMPAKQHDGTLFLVDPFCGSGTILLEALEIMANKDASPRLRCVGLDVSKRSAQGATENAEATGYTSATCEFHTCDARAIRKHIQDESVDAIVSNLPWGVRTGHKQTVSDLQQLYEVFLRSAWYTLKPGGRVVVLVLRGLQMIRILRKLGGRYRILAVKIVRTTNNLPAVVVVEKLETDVLRDEVKQQLGQLSPFVSVSTEMYHAINYEDIDEAN